MTNFMNIDATRVQNAPVPTNDMNQSVPPARSDVVAFEKAMRPEEFSKEKPLSESDAKAGREGTAAQTETDRQTTTLESSGRSKDKSAEGQSGQTGTGAGKNVGEESFGLTDKHATNADTRTGTKPGQTSVKENSFSQMSNPLDSLFGKPAQQQTPGAEAQLTQSGRSSTDLEQSLKDGMLLSEQDETGDILPQMNTLESPFNRMNAPQVNQTAPAQAAPPSGELIDTLVDRILLSQSKDGNSEIRISLNNSSLPDTEIRLVRGNDGQLTVQMLTNNASSFQTMVAAQDTLRLRLEQQEINVRVEVSSQTEQENNDSRRQSRGYVEETHED